MAMYHLLPASYRLSAGHTNILRPPGTTLDGLRVPGAVFTFTIISVHLLRQLCGSVRSDVFADKIEMQAGVAISDAKMDSLRAFVYR